MKAIYLDYNATTPIDPLVADTMIPILKGVFGNPSSTHKYGQEAKKEIEDARKKIAKLINANPYEIIFTSGGTESNNLAIKGVAYSLRDKGNHIITSSVEHPAVLEVCKSLEREGFIVSYLEVDKYGRVDPERIRASLKTTTILVSIMHANNEVGTIQPIEEIGKILKDTGIVFHCDAAQSIGKIPVDVDKLGVGLLSIAGHKFYGPKGVGALYIREGTKLQKLMYGANHENNLRPGTENILEIAGIGKAAEIAMEELQAGQLQMKETRDLLYNMISDNLPDTILNGHPEFHLPNTLSLSFPGVDISLLLSLLTDVAASAGAACHAEKITYSHVLRSMGVSPEIALGTIRLSTGKNTTLDEIKTAARLIIGKVNELRSNRPEDIKASVTEKIKLTHYTHGLGCACKISPRILEEVLKKMPPALHPDILVGPETSDDAAVYRINKNTAIVQSVDFFTPVIDDPFQFGAIAAANALSDIYAMGAKPLFGLNIVGFPHLRLPLVVLDQILAGAGEVCAEAGIQILGGHTIEDNEPKFGMVITGSIHPEKIIRNKGAKPGDLLILTKAIGTGILSTALKRGFLSEETTVALYNNMRALNKTASEIMLNYSISACTDISGFGLLGHLKEMLESSGTGAVIKYKNIPVLPEVANFAAQGIVPGGTENNRNYLETFVEWDNRMTENQKNILADAQTSGGLLISVSKNDGLVLQKELINKGIIASIIGEVSREKNPMIKILA